MRPPIIRAFLGDDEIIVDLFAGGGGASTGIHRATGRSPDIAINHSPEAIALHEANHPTTRHYIESVYKVDPRRAAGGKPVALLWLSPDCTHHSKAKGGKPRDQKLRGLAWSAIPRHRHADAHAARGQGVRQRGSSRLRGGHHGVDIREGRMTRRRRIHQRRSSTELDLHVVARQDQPSAPREPVDRDQELAAWWSTWLTGTAQTRAPFPGGPGKQHMRAARRKVR